MILKIIIASIVIYLVYLLLKNRREHLEASGEQVFDSCKSKCDDNYARCIRGNCKQAIASNERRRRQEMEKVGEHNTIEERKECVSKCSGDARARAGCAKACFGGDEMLTDKMISCYNRCDEDYVDRLDHDDCIARCYTDEINLDREMSNLLAQNTENFTVEHMGNGPQNGPDLDIAVTPVESPKDDTDTLDINGFTKYVNDKEFYTIPGVIMLKLFNKINAGKNQVERDVYENYKPYLSDIGFNFNEFDSFVSLNSLRVLSTADRRQMFKRLDSSSNGYITYSQIVKGIDRVPMQYSYTSFVSIIKIYLRKLGILNEFRDIHYRKLFQLAKREDKRPIDLIETMEGNVVDATSNLNDRAARMNPMRMTDFTADSDVTGTRDYILKSELDILLNPIIRDINAARVNKLLERVLYDNQGDIQRDLDTCTAVGRERIDIAPVVNDDDIDDIVNRVRDKMVKCAPPPTIPKEPVENNVNKIAEEADKYRNTEELINTIGKDLINSGLFKSYVESKCGFFCPANDEYVQDDKSLILPRDARKGTVFDIWNPTSVNQKEVKESESISGRDLSYRNTDYWNRVPRKVLDKVCTDKNCVVKPHND